MRGRAIYLLYQLGPEGQKRAGTPRSCTGSGIAHCCLPGDAARRARHHARGRRGSPATPLPASAAKWRCPCATSRVGRWLDILVNVARGYDGQDRSYLEALGTGATGEGTGAFRSAKEEGARRGG